MKHLLLAMILLGTFVVISIGWYLTPSDMDCGTPQGTGRCARADAIIAVSGGDTSARADHAIALYKQDWAPKLIFSGAAADPSGPSNAAAMARRALAAGVLESDIIIEEFSRTTQENAQNTSRFIAEHEINRAILVTSAYHQRRAALEFGASLGGSVELLNYPVSRDKHWAGIWWWTTSRGWWLAGSELIKILAFYSAQGVKSL